MQRERMIFPDERPIHTPWGVADYAREYAEGIVFYGTPSHGGFKLSAERLAQMHSALREKDGWFEEDCAWAKVAFAFPECFADEQREAAIRTLKDWCPDEYEAVIGKTLAPGDSHTKDQRLFHECHAQDWMVISAIRSDQYTGMVEYIRANFQTLMHAAENDDLALMECADAETGAPRYVICAVGRNGGEYLFTPFGHLAEGNPYEAYRPPE